METFEDFLCSIFSQSHRKLPTIHNQRPTLANLNLRPSAAKPPTPAAKAAQAWAAPVAAQAGAVRISGSLLQRRRSVMGLETHWKALILLW